MSFLNFTILDALDILLAAWLLYQLYKLVRGTVAINIFIGVTAIYLVWKLTEALQMNLLSEILGQFIGVGFIALIIVFQQEIRRFLLVLGSANFGRNRSWFRPFNWLRNEEQIKLEVDAVVTATLNLAEGLTGALIVLERKSPLGQYAQTGDFLDAKLNSRLLEAIFMKDSPMHDGAVIVRENKVQAARAILPVSENNAIPARYGLRHRAAVGLSEKTDALCVVVSEETGTISLIHSGRIVNVKRDELRAKLIEALEH
ncbi:MAG: diadenylate cyclase CdaA [Bacteroidota bacterium]|nr:diadenylate cyclase CdaA [Bacteroidota bacterium]MDX5427411.1 diadenylate cyclase CdaA [Bacteroidota bacterium]MDX5447469.1 diadenylate cyclase CdaA [Bacteroidota bacterium]MDX5505356.1 diadenylate cyclase CdaA [Bacteroidota bacterium]